MKTAKQLKEERGEKLDALNAITTTAQTEKREFNAEEVTKFDALEIEIRELNTSIIRAEAAERLAAEAATRSKAPLGKDTNEDKRQADIAKYSVRQAIVDSFDKKQPAGIIAEMQQEAEKEARDNGQYITGIGIPAMVMRQAGSAGRERRDNSITMPTQPEDGSALVQTTKDLSMLDMLKNRLMTANLGATVFTDLVGPVDFVRMTQRPTATWKPEVANLDVSSAKFGTPASLAPHRLGTQVFESLQFLRQTAPMVDAMIKQKIVYAIAEGIDLAAIFGTGTNNQPLGVLNDPDVTYLALGANGAQLTRANLIALETALMEANLLETDFRWLLNARTAGFLKGTPIAAAGATTIDGFLMQNNTELLGYPAVVSNAIANATTKNTGTNLSAIVLGAWNNLFIGQWGGIDLVVDGLTQIAAGQIRIVAQAFADVTVFDGKAFTGYKDVKNV